MLMYRIVNTLTVYGDNVTQQTTLKLHVQTQHEVDANTAVQYFNFPPFLFVSFTFSFVVAVNTKLLGGDPWSQWLNPFFPLRFWSFTLSRLGSALT